MLKTVEILIPPHASGDADFLKRTVAKKIEIAPSQINHISVLRRSIDARKPPVKLRLLAAVYTGKERFTEIPFTYSIQHVHQSPAVVIIGAGPAGIFAALTLIEHGIKPIILERGKEIQARKLDIAQLNRHHLLDPDSNYCFGEGGAGTFSDGKLYTRATKRGDVKRILNLLVWHGADPDILVEAHPHIGSDKLPPLIGNIRKTILEAGGEIHYNTRVEAFIQKGKALAAVVDQRGTHYEAAQYILATGHSARDIYQLFHNNQWAIEAKPFALGVRVEHPQSLINEIQYHTKDYDAALPPAAYTLTTQVNNSGVYSFCMCPGGVIVPASTDPTAVVVNGMSNSKRNGPFANAGVVTAIHPATSNRHAKYGALSGLVMQEQLERAMQVGGENTQYAPAQLLTDFLAKKISDRLPVNSYKPGAITAPVHQLLPIDIYQNLAAGIQQFNKKMKGFITREAIVFGVESRTSSPVRIIRDKETLTHPQLTNLYPCGEGAGYAGGIVSSAVDGDNMAKAIAQTGVHS